MLLRFTRSVWTSLYLASQWLLLNKELHEKVISFRIEIRSISQADKCHNWSSGKMLSSLSVLINTDTFYVNSQLNPFANAKSNAVNG